MATSVLTFNLSGTAQDTSSCRFDVQVDPPQNIRGRQCYVEATFFGWDNGTTITPSLNSRDTFYVTSNWTQVNSHMNTNGRPMPASPAAVFMSNISYGTGPILTIIPDGPHTVSFTVKRGDGGKVNEDTTATNYMLLSLKIVAANSRQPQIGV